MEFILIILFFFTIFELAIGYSIEEAYFKKPIGHISNLQYKTVFVSQGNGVKLECSDGIKNDSISKCNTSVSWSVSEIDFRNKNNFNYRVNVKHFRPKKLEMFDDNSLLIRKVNIRHTKLLFSCYKNSTNSNITDTIIYNYMIEIIKPDTDICEGEITDWTNFSLETLKPLQDNLEQTFSSKDKRISLEIDWTDWSPCLCYLFQFTNRRFKFGYPLIRINSLTNCMNKSSELYYIRSEKFKAFHPCIANKINKLKVFKFYESCVGFCEDRIEVNYTNFKYEQVIKAEEGTDLTITCPGSILINSETLWVKDTDYVVQKLEDTVGSDTEKSVVCVDMQNTLHLNNITMKMEGHHYSCFVNRIPMKTFVVDVSSAKVYKYDELFESLLSLVLVMLFCLLVVVINSLKKLYDYTRKSVNTNHIEA